MNKDEFMLQAEGISKRFGGLLALDNVALQVKKGHVHALVGENGAGKSTMMNIIGGVIPRDSGSIVFDGKEVDFPNPMAAINSGIAIIHQELSMMPDLNIIENVYMGRMETKHGRILWDRMAEKTRAQLAKLHLDLNPYLKIGSLPTSQQQMVEIAKAISIHAKLIIMDEPNSSLTEQESEKLFRIVEELKESGIAIIYVSHKIEEVLRISDEVTVFRDGKYIDTLDAKELDCCTIIRLMVGRDVQISNFERSTRGEPLLDVKHLSGDRFSDISFSLRRGEILGFYGLVGAGRSELCRAIFGVDPIRSGELYLEGNPVRFATPKDAIAHGFAMLAEDRKNQSIFPGLPIWLNLGVSVLPNVSRKGVIDYGRVWEIVTDFTDKFKIKYANRDNPIGSLSGGNQQKVILARWLATKPKVLILDEPTHGVDVGAKEDIYNFIVQLSKEGLGILFISSEMPEIMALCHRVIVMHEGTDTGTLEAGDLNQEKIMALAAGLCDCQ